MKQKNKKGGFLSMLIGTLGARAGEGKIRVG